MTIKEKSDTLHKAFLDAWDQYKKIETQHTASTGLKELLSAPKLKEAYQKWQMAVNDYYDFARSVEHRRLSEEIKA